MGQGGGGRGFTYYFFPERGGSPRGNKAAAAHSGSSAPHSRCPPLSAGISQGPSSSPSYLEGSPDPRPARVPHFSLSAVSFSSGASTTPPACLLPSKARSPPAFQPSNTGAPRALSGRRRAVPHQHDHPPGAEDDAAGGQLGPTAQKRRHEEGGRGSSSCGRSGKVARGRPGRAREERAGPGGLRRGGRAAGSAAKGAWPQAPTIAPGGPRGIAGRLRALPDLRQGKAVCEAEAAPQKPLRTLVAGVRCCSSNASRFWSPTFQAGMGGPGVPRDQPGKSREEEPAGAGRGEGGARRPGYPGHGLLGAEACSSRGFPADGLVSGAGLDGVVSPLLPCLAGGDPDAT
uniref:Uncharacterized protein n=1 Tax=Mustela putorius furo TaxID=9669 RepID=M3YGZ7_MUSPF